MKSTTMLSDVAAHNSTITPPPIQLPQRRRRLLLLLLLLVVTVLLGVVGGENVVDGEYKNDMILYSLPYYDSINNNGHDESTVGGETTPNIARKKTRVGTVDVFQLQQQEGNDENDMDEIGICHLPYVVPFTFPPGTVAPVRVPFNTWYLHQGVISIALATHHLNVGDGRVIPEVQGLNERCNIRFTFESFDTNLQERVAVDHALDIMNREYSGSGSGAGGGGTATVSIGSDGETATDDDGNDASTSRTDQPNPCLFVGAGRSSSSIAMSTVTGLRGYPMFSPLSQSIALDNKEQHPFFGRFTTSQEGTVIPVVRFFNEVLGVKHLGIVHANDDYGNSYARAFQNSVRKYAPDMQLRIIDVEADITSLNSPEANANAIQFLKSTGYKYFLAVIYGYDAFMEEAFKQGIAGNPNGSYNWMFTESVATSIGTYPKNSPLYFATQGISMAFPLGSFYIEPFDTIPVDPTFAKLREAWYELAKSPKDVEYIISKLPVYEENPNYWYDYVMDTEGVETFFTVPYNGNHHASTEVWNYDTVIAAGLAACSLQQKQMQEEGEGDSNAAGSSTKYQYFTGQQHYNEIITNTLFHGTSGRIKLNNKTGTRDPTTGTFAITNWYDPSFDTHNRGSTSTSTTNETEFIFAARNTHVYINGEFQNVAEHYFNDGTNKVRPDLSPNNIDYNFIGRSLRIVGLCLSGLVILLAICFSLWTHMHRKTRVVKASQPIFLHLICLGTLLEAASIIPLSFDDERYIMDNSRMAEEAKGKHYNLESDEESSLNIACMSVPWLFCIGFVISFSSLFAKTWRINRIFHNPTMKRIKVTALDVMMPLFGFLVVNAILLTLWTAMSPLTWKREVTVLDEYARPISSFGQCSHSDHDDDDADDFKDGDNFGLGVIFLICLAVVNVGVLAVALYQAYVARDISVEFAESEYILKALCCAMLVSLVGVPVMIIATEEPAAFFFIFSSIIFVLSGSLLLFMFIPKIAYHYKVKTKKGKSRKSGIQKFFRKRTPSQQQQEEPSAGGSMMLDSTSDIMSVDEGLAVIDTAAMREVMKDEYKQLVKRVTELERRNAELESIVHEKPDESAIAANTAANGVNVTNTQQEEAAAKPVPMIEGSQIQSMPSRTTSNNGDEEENADSADDER